jgi:hypothetical protein
MTITGSGQISLNDLNVEFGRSGTSQLSLSQSFAGTYAQYGAINRNTLPGQNIYAQFATIFTDFALDIFYDYNDVENNFWDYYFINNAANDCDVQVKIGGVEIFVATLAGSGGEEQSFGNYVDTSTSAGTGADLDLLIKLNKGGINNVDITVTDPDTTDIIYSTFGNVAANGYDPSVNLATLYGYQRMQWNITLSD